MAFEKLHGTGVALVTPFNEDLSIDFEGLKSLLTFTTDKGVDYFVVMGTTGESVTLSPDEKKQVLDFVKNNNPKNLPIVYGIGGNNTAEILKQLAQFDNDGVSAVLSVSPYYNKPSQEGIYHHYANIADTSPVPVILYNVPGRTGSNITAKTTLRLAEHGNIVAIKEASGNLEQAMQIVKNKPEDFLLISGDDLLTVPLYSLGSVGVISVLANAFADIFKEINQSVINKDFDKATSSLIKLLDINPLMYAQSNPVGIKHVLQEYGVCKNYVRLPLVSATAELQQQIREMLEKMN